MSIRKMEWRDLEDVVGLYLWANQYALRENVSEWTQESLKEFPEYHFVSEENGRVVGAVSATFDGIAELQDLAVAPQYRGRGIGGELLEEALARLEEDGAKETMLWVHWRNKDAIPFYERHGFFVVEERVTRGIKGVPDGENITVMRKRPSPPSEYGENR